MISSTVKNKYKRIFKYSIPYYEKLISLEILVQIFDISIEYIKMVNENLEWTDGTYLLLSVNREQRFGGINVMYKNDIYVECC